MAHVTLRGNPVKLVGSEVKVGDTAPDFKTQKSDLSDYNLSSSAGKTRILLSIPSLDTPVCDAETKRFNDEAAKVPVVEIPCIGMDLPFPMKRCRGEAAVENITTARDHREASFAITHAL